MVALEVLVEGVWFAMEQAGRLLQSGNKLFDAGDFSSAVALSMFAHEELGRSRILLDLAMQVHQGGKVEAEYLRKACNDHVEKQKLGALSLTYFGSKDEPLGAALTSRMNSQPGTPEYRAAQQKIDAITEEMMRALPRQRHLERMSSVYVDFDVQTLNWLRPSQVRREEAIDRLTSAANDYSVGRQWFDEPLLSTTDQGLLTTFPKFALLRLAKPHGLEIAPPVWPGL